MSDRLPATLARLERGRERILATVREMTPDQRGFRAEEGCWSAQQVLHHVFLAESLSLGAMEKAAGQTRTPRTLAQRIKKAAVGFILKNGIRVKNPAPPTTPDPAVDFDEVAREWPSVASRLAELLGRAEDPTAAAGFRHPIAGPLSLAESVEFLAAHVEHHQRQLERLRATDGFPSG